MAKKLITEELKKELITGAGTKSKTVMKDKDVEFKLKNKKR
jgi:hypothetical protein